MNAGPLAISKRITRSRVAGAQAVRYYPVMESPRKPLRALPSGFDQSALAVAVIVLLSRLPFLGKGLGTDNDAWGVFRAGRDIALTGKYEVSRFPGFPIPEYFASLLWRGGPWAINGASALMCVAASLLFMRVLRRSGARDAALGAIAFAFVPTIYISSTAGMDYLWACAFLMAALLFTMKRWILPAGIAMGLATGCRITSITLLLPLSWMLLWGRPKEPGSAVPAARSSSPFGEVLGLTVSAMITGAALFIPAYRSYGFGFLAYYEPGGGSTRSITQFLSGLLQLNRLPFSPFFIFGIATVGVWGLLGAAALAATLAFTAVRPGRAAPSPMPRGFFVACLVAVIVVGVLFLRLPDDEGYLIPALPFVFILLARVCEQRVFKAFCILMILSPFAFGVDSVPPKKGITPGIESRLVHRFGLGRETFVVDPLRGPLRMDQDKRRAEMDILEKVGARWGELPSNAVVIAGLLCPPLSVQIKPDSVIAVNMISLEDLRRAVSAGRPVFYLPDAPERTQRFLHYSLTDMGAKPFIAAVDSARAR